ncbi:hypothetical protein BAC1_00349 [uncultured bacterium]|nr:hypothetical protein BAC1_00349 [uncultured bacterium]
MHKKYENPPIIEAVCEFRLTPDTQWDLTTPGLIYEKISKEFVNKEEISLQEVTLVKTAEGLQHSVRPDQRIRFLTDDKKTFIQLGTRLLAVNRLKPYSTWEDFKPKIENAFSALNETVDISSFQRIGLRYINRIDIPSQTVDLDQYFDFKPFLGKGLPQLLKSFIVGCEIPFRDGQDSCKVQLTNTIPETPASSSYVLDLNYFLATAEAISKQDALEWVENAHNILEDIFEGCITDSLRAIFKESV